MKNIFAKVTQKYKSIEYEFISTCVCENFERQKLLFAKYGFSWPKTMHAPNERCNYFRNLFLVWKSNSNAFCSNKYLLMRIQAIPSFYWTKIEYLVWLIKIIKIIYSRFIIIAHLIRRDAFSEYSQLISDKVQ